MSKSNMDVDFIDSSTDDEEKHKHERAHIAHKLAVVIMFDKHAKAIKKGKGEEKKRIVKKGALNA